MGRSMSDDLRIVIDELIAPAGRVDADALAAAVGAELERLLAGNEPLPLEQLSDAGTIRLTTALSADRLADPDELAGELARVIATASVRGQRWD
jgi:hypothetical protein